MCVEFTNEKRIPEMDFYHEGKVIYKVAQVKSGIVTGFWATEKVADYESLLCKNKATVEENLKLPADQQKPLSIAEFPKIDDGLIPEFFLVKHSDVTVRVEAHFLRVFAFAEKVSEAQKNKSITKKEYKEMCKQYSYPSIYVP